MGNDIQGNPIEGKDSVIIKCPSPSPKKEDKKEGKK
jgi:hypothetical protein